jgi:7-keto-8-aminopelargonate synthetase-like enzyme
MNDLSPLMQQTFEIMTLGKSYGVLYGHYSDHQLDGRMITLNGRKLVNFANCSYLGLEVDHRLKESAKDAIDRYGIQFSCSRTYLESNYYEIFEDKLSQIFDQPVIIPATTSLGHISYIPAVVAKDDAIILDHKVHQSVKNAVMMCKGMGTHVEVVRHNRMDLLEERVKYLSGKYKKIWYMADGVYSMLGDLAPMKEIYELLNQYDQFYFYVDDAHGMSWAGKHGRGYVLGQVDYFHPKMCFSTSLVKGFGAHAAALVFPDEMQKLLIKTTGTTLIFCGPVPPAILAAGITSADIHLSEEIYLRQEGLIDLITHFNQKAIELDLPLVRHDISPIRFMGTTGSAQICSEIAFELQQAGFFVNAASYPSVPLKNTGIRMTIHLHLTKDDIDNLLYNVRRIYDEKGVNTEEVLNNFREKQVESLQ